MPIERSVQLIEHGVEEVDRWFGQYCDEDPLWANGADDVVGELL